jgi:uncharacterized membrane protein/predicted DsbA family dithiol-disulfide isomerase
MGSDGRLVSEGSGASPVSPASPASPASVAGPRVASLAVAVSGLAASAALLVDYLRPVPLFCAEGSGCDAVKHTPFAAPFGVPLPAVGLAGFLAIGVVALLAGRRARIAQVALSAGAALAGALLLVIQVLLGHFCPYCSVADASGVAGLVAASWWLTRPVEVEAPRWLLLAGGAPMAVAVAVPLLLGLYVPVRIPPAIVAEMAGAPPGQLTVVDFVDFECPFCRMTQQELEPVLEAHKDRLHVVRRQVPLRSHAHALDAARAACCAEQMGKGDAMAESLFSAAVDTLTPEGCERVAEHVGLAVDPYRACVTSPATDARIEADRAEFKAAGGYALPTIWIGKRQLVGARSKEEIAKVIEEELAASGG